MCLLLLLSPNFSLSNHWPIHTNSMRKMALSKTLCLPLPVEASVRLLASFMGTAMAHWLRLLASFPLVLWEHRSGPTLQLMLFSQTGLGRDLFLLSTLLTVASLVAPYRSWFLKTPRC